MRKERQNEGYKDCFAQGFGHGAGRAGARLLGRASSALTVVLAVVVALGALVPRAFAVNQYDPEMVIDGNVVDGTHKGYMCVNANRFTATLELIGKMGDYVSIDTEKYNRLNAAGGFRICMDRWQELTEDANEDIENSWLGGDAFIDGWLILSGKGNCWYGTFTDEQIQTALTYYENIMNGGGSGGEGGGSGGEGGGSGGDTVTINGKDYVLFDTEDVPEGFEQRERTFAGVAVPEQYLNWLTAQLADLSYGSTGKFWIAVCDNYSSSSSYVTFAAVGTMPVFGTTYSNPSYTWSAWSEGNNVASYGKQLSTVTSTRYYEYDDKKYLIYGNNTGRGVSTDVGSVDTCRPVYSYYYGDFEGNSEGGGGSEEPDPDPEPDPEPDPDVPSPTPPDPPTLPDPKDPTVPRTPEPETPTPEPTTPRLPDPIVVTVPTNTSPTDYTPWLEAILRELQGIHTDMADYLQEFLDEMSNHCLHLREEMATQAGYIGECLDVVAQTSAGVGDQVESAIWDYAGWLAEYLDGLAEWMVEHMSFNTTVENNVTADPYDDTSLMYWLRRIYTKLGAGGPVSTKPTDPTTDPNGTNDWLTRLWQNFLTALSDLIPSVDLGNSLDALKTKFPFSIPWDVLAIMTMLVAPAQTPDVDIPQYALDANGDIELVGSYELDLEDYDAAMGGVRLILKISFVVFLMVHTKDFMELIEAVIPT